jgi:flagellar motility protein MotE (MotC chaperone)
MKFCWNDLVRTLLRVAAPVCSGLVILYSYPGCAAEASSPWQASVTGEQNGPNDETSSAPRNAANVRATKEGGGRSAKAASNLSKRGASERPQQASERRLETGSVDAVNSAPSHLPVPALPVAAPQAGLLEASSTAGRFCVNIKPQVEELRIAFQKKTLAEIELELDKRLKLLDGKITEYKQWLQRRQDFSSKAQDALVKIYTKMRPDAAAQQLTTADTETAAAVLLKLDPRVASAILNDMDPKRAAELAAVITGAAQTNDVASKPAGAVP